MSLEVKLIDSATGGKMLCISGHEVFNEHYPTGTDQKIIIQDLKTVRNKLVNRLKNAFNVAAEKFLLQHLGISEQLRNEDVQ